MQHTFFPPQQLSPDIVFIHVNITVNSTGVYQGVVVGIIHCLINQSILVFASVAIA